MCMNFVYYYPRIPNFELCQSTISPKSLFDFVRQLAKYKIRFHNLKTQIRFILFSLNIYFSEKV